MEGKFKKGKEVLVEKTWASKGCNLRYPKDNCYGKKWNNYRKS